MLKVQITVNKFSKAAAAALILAGAHIAKINVIDAASAAGSTTEAGTLYGPNGQTAAAIISNPGPNQTVQITTPPGETLTQGEQLVGKATGKGDPSQDVDATYEPCGANCAGGFGIQTTPAPAKTPKPTTNNTDTNTNANTSANYNKNDNINTADAHQNQAQQEQQSQAINNSGNSKIENAGNSSIKNSGDSSSQSSTKLDNVGNASSISKGGNAVANGGKGGNASVGNVAGGSVNGVSASTGAVSNTNTVSPVNSGNNAVSFKSTYTQLPDATNTAQVFAGAGINSASNAPCTDVQVEDKGGFGVTLYVVGGTIKNHTISSQHPNNECFAKRALEQQQLQILTNQGAVASEALAAHSPCALQVATVSETLTPEALAAAGGFEGLYAKACPAPTPVPVAAAAPAPVTPPVRHRVRHVAPRRPAAAKSGCVTKVTICKP